MTRRLFLAVYVRVASWLVLVGNDVSLLGCCELVLGVVGLDVAPHRGDFGRAIVVETDGLLVLIGVVFCAPPYLFADLQWWSGVCQRF